MPAHEPPVVAEVVRSRRVESRHRGTVVTLDDAGTVTLALGDVTSPIYPRSANKPLQAVGMLRAGLRLSGELLALAAASHGGHPLHIDGVRKILAGAGLDESALRTPPSLPLDAQAAGTYLRGGGEPAPIQSDCSGKHAAMLATCVANDWPVDGYRTADHPLQRALAAAVADLAGESIEHVGLDGCGAPLFALGLTGLARAYRTLVLAPPGTLERQVADAMRAHPDYVAGAGLTVTELMRTVPGLLAKSGAEGVMALALPDGRAAALKIDDGSSRALRALTGAMLRALGVDDPAVAELVRTPVLGGGHPVGEIRTLV